MKHLATAAAALALTACGYGWKEENSNAYPPSAGGQVVQGQSADRPNRVIGPDEYRVQPGDTLFAIGFKNQLDYRDIANWNGIGSDYRIRAGQVLRLTPPAGTNAVLAHAPVNEDMSAQALPPSGPPIAAPRPIPASTLPGPVTQAPVLPATPVLNVPAVPRVTSAASSNLHWQWPTSGNMIKAYNMAAGSKGIDISGELGQPVVAVGNGKVVYSGSALKGYGELIIVKHDDTYLSAYGHNRRRLVKEGDEVRAGQTIAELGLGPEQKPLVHFEIRENGKPVDPLLFLPDKVPPNR